jgi:hypothetical protein
MPLLQQIPKTQERHLQVRMTRRSSFVQFPSVNHRPEQSSRLLRRPMWKKRTRQRKRKKRN